MLHSWHDRAYSAEEAASLAGIKRATLDVWLSRHRGVVFSERRHARRWFSPRDIMLLRLAVELERCGLRVGEALRAALLALDEKPKPDAMLLVAGKGTLTISASDIAALPIDTTQTLIPVGRLAAEIIAACTAA